MNGIPFERINQMLPAFINTNGKGGDIWGFNADISNAPETICDCGTGLYTYPAAASVMKVSSAHADDDAATGEGAHTVQVWGLDANYEEITDTVTMDGLVASLTINSYIRIHKVQVITAGTQLDNAGQIYVGTGNLTNGVPDNIFGSILADHNSSNIGRYTIPAGHRGYITSFHASSFGTGSNVATAWLAMRPEGQVFSKESIVQVQNGTAPAEHKFIIEEVAEKTDIELRGESSNADVAISARVEILVCRTP